MRAAPCLARALVTTAALTIAAAPAAAQTPDTSPDPATRSRIRFGSLWINPVLTVKNIGIDTNVFNEAENPKRDFTATVTPLTDVYIRSGTVRADMRVTSDLVYYRRYDAERSSNTEYSGLFSLLPLTRVSPYAGASYTNTRDRPGYEVDARARHTITKYRAGVDLRVGTGTTFGLDLSRARTDFVDRADFRGVSLGEQLDRTESAARLIVRQALTPLTRAVVAAEVQSDRFEFNRERNTDSYRVTGGFEFEPVALVSGTATVGYRELTFIDRSIAGQRGLVTAVNVEYTMLPLTHLGIKASRDTLYSYDPERPYYVQSGGNVVLTQNIFASWDVQVSGGLQRLGYADRSGVRAANDVDRVTLYGAGIGYRLGRETRIGVNYTRSRRRSPEPPRRYEGTQIGTSITYGR